MPLLRPPFRILVLDSPHSVAELIGRLAHDLDPDVGLFGRPPGHHGWIGFVKAEGMEIRRRTPFRNSFLPIVRARFEPGAEGTRVRVSMSLMLTTRVFLGLWALLATVALAGLVSTREPVLLAVPGMLAAAFLMAAIGFNLEADQAEFYLRERVLERG